MSKTNLWYVAMLKQYLRRFVKQKLEPCCSNKTKINVLNYQQDQKQNYLIPFLFSLLKYFETPPLLHVFLLVSCCTIDSSVAFLIQNVRPQQWT